MRLKNTSIVNSCYRYQSTDAKKVLVDFLTDHSNNNKWLEYACRKLCSKAQNNYTGCLEPEDYLSIVKAIILDIVIVEDTNMPFLRFRIDKDGESLFLTRKELFSYVFVLIKWEMSHSLRDEQYTVPMPEWYVNKDPDLAADEDIPLAGDNPGSDFIVLPDDPFDETKKYTSKEFIEVCSDKLEREDVLFRVIFEELLDGTKNKTIAHKYNLTVRRVENISKTIHRRILQFSKSQKPLNSS